MNKKDALKVKFQLHRMKEIQDLADTAMVEIIEVAFSNLATSNPNLALEVMNGIVSSKDAILANAEENAGALSEFLEDNLTDQEDEES